MRAYCLVRPQPAYRRDAFVAGLRAAGLEVASGMPDAQQARGSVVVIWNRYGESHQLAQRVEQAGGRVLVAENGYLGVGGRSPKYESGADNYYALAEGYHNGGGRWPCPDGAERWARLGIALQPMRRADGHILVCPNRSFGVPERMMPPDWPERTADRLRKKFGKVRVRSHPGNDAPKVPLAEDLKDASVVVVWYSSAGLHAMIAGVPVVAASPHWIGRSAAFESVEAALGGEWDAAELDARRLATMQRLACAQWTAAELASGEPFRRLLA